MSHDLRFITQSNLQVYLLKLMHNNIYCISFYIIIFIRSKKQLPININYTYPYM